MRRLWPIVSAAGAGADTELDDAELARLYDFPEALDRPWVKVNFVSSLDGGVTVGGRSAGLSNPDDRRVLRLGRDLADVVLVGAGTALTEGYRGVSRGELRTTRREARGLAPVPPIAVVSRRCSIEPRSPLLTDTQVPPLVFTTAAAPRQRRDALVAAGAEVVVVGEETVDLPGMCAALDERGLRRVCCEGGPSLFGSMITAGIVDELCLSLAPLLTAGDAARVAHGTLPDAPLRMTLASVLRADDLLLLRYLRS